MKKIFFVLSLFVLSVLLAACGKTNKMIGTYKMTSYKLGGEEQATKDIMKAYDKYDVPFGVLTVEGENKAKIYFTEDEEEWSCKFDEEYFTDSENNSYEYTFEESDGALVLSGKKDGVKVKLSFGKISDEVQKLNKLIQEDDVEKVIKANAKKRMEGSWKVVNYETNGEELFEGFSDYLSELEKEGFYYGRLVIQKDGNARLHLAGENRNCSYDDNEFYLYSGWNMDSKYYRYELDDDKLILTEKEPSSGSGEKIIFKRMTDEEASRVSDSNGGTSSSAMLNMINKNDDLEYYNNTSPLKSVGNITLKMWCIATESDSYRKSYEKAIADLKNKYPNINFQWDAYENESYKERIKAAMAADEVPDIFFTWSCAFLNDFVQAGKVYCLDDTLAKYVNSGDISEAMLGNSTFNGKHYGVPMTYNMVGFFANMDILRRVGYTEIPKTYDDLIKCCDKLVSAGYYPFGCAGGETWCVSEYLESIIEKNIGADALNDIFMGRNTYYNQGMADAVNIFQDMIKKDYFDPQGATLGNDEIKSRFLNGYYAFYMNGTWNCFDFVNYNYNGYDIQIGEFPVIDSSKSSLGEYIGGPSDTLAVSNSSKNAAVAAEYTAELGKLICMYGYLDGCGLPSWKVDYDDSIVSSMTKAAAAMGSNAKKVVLFGDTAMSAADRDIYLNYLYYVYSGYVNGDTFIYGLYQDLR